MVWLAVRHEFIVRNSGNRKPAAVLGQRCGASFAGGRMSSNVVLQLMTAPGDKMMDLVCLTRPDSAGTETAVHVGCSTTHTAPVCDVLIVAVEACLPSRHSPSGSEYSTSPFVCPLLLCEAYIDIFSYYSGRVSRVAPVPRIGLYPRAVSTPVTSPQQKAPFCTPNGRPPRIRTPRASQP